MRFVLELECDKLNAATGKPLLDEIANILLWIVSELKDGVPARGVYLEEAGLVGSFTLYPEETNP